MILPAGRGPAFARHEKEIRMRTVLCTTLAVGLALATTAPAADPPPEEKTGLKVGEKAPAFKLKDQAGKERTLEEFVKQGKVALVFYRSAGW
jgi:cytochrome oxidase Cu insertion factor (SCO1/SenC/PrrC family)